MIEPMNIAIVGGSLGGLATAIALLKHGFNVQVYEQAQALQSTGTGLTLTPNGLNSLDTIQLGLVESLKQAGSPTNTHILKRSSGETITSTPITVMQDYGQPVLNIQRSRLQAILTAVLPPGSIQLNHRCVGFEQLDTGVKLFFPGEKTVEADLLIGADGINSVVRQNLVSDGFPNYTDRVSWQAMLQFEHERLSPNESTLLTAPDGKNFVLLDVGEGYTYWSATALSADDFVHQRATTPKNRVLERFADWAEPVGAIIEATPAEDIVEQPICDRLSLQRWSEGRVTLLGDAAHAVVPSLGQGANIAFEDACELAACLSVTSSVETALEGYEKSRIPRMAVIHHYSAILGYCSYQLDNQPPLSKMMNSQMSQDEFQSWLYSYHPSISHQGIGGGTIQQAV